jgi:hypothetical protein
MQSMGYFPCHFFAPSRASALPNLSTAAFLQLHYAFQFPLQGRTIPPHHQLVGNQATPDILQWTTASGKEQDHFHHKHK